MTLESLGGYGFCTMSQVGVMELVTEEWSSQQCIPICL